MDSFIDFARQNKRLFIISAIGGAIIAGLTPIAIKIIANLTLNPRNTLMKIKRLYGYLIDKYAITFNVPKTLIASIICYESGGDPNKRGSSGETGLMQIMPFHTKTPEKLTDPEFNIALGTKILREHYNKYKDWHLSVMAYNTGTGNVDRIINRLKTRDWQEIVKRKNEIEKFAPATAKWTIPYLTRVFGKGGILEIARTVFV